MINFEKRYDGENSVYYLQTVYNEPVIQRLELISGGLSYEVVTARHDSIHVQKLPVDVPNGTYTVLCHAENEVGLTIIGEIPFEIQLDYYSIDTNAYEQIDLEQLLIPNRSYADFDGNGRYNFLAYEENDNQNQTSIYEIDQDTLVYKYLYTDFMTPRAIGDTNGSRLELIGVSGDTAKLFEVPSSADSFPTQQIYSWPDVYGADFIDYNGDGENNCLDINDAVVYNTNGFADSYIVTGIAPASFEENSKIATIIEVAPAEPYITMRNTEYEDGIPGDNLYAANWSIARNDLLHYCSRYNAVKNNFGDGTEISSQENWDIMLNYSSSCIPGGYGNIFSFDVFLKFSEFKGSSNKS